MKFLYIISLLVIFSTNLFAQWECPSALGANIKPIAESIPVSWGVELTSAAGLMSDKKYLQEMVFAGIDLTIKNHHFYVEGGYKYWYKFIDKENKGINNQNFGLRELFYNYTGENTNLIAGFHSISLDDHFLVSERAYGISYRQKIKKFALNVGVASVTKDFARNGTFCSKGFVYDVINIPRAQLGNSFGQTNFAGITLTYDPQKIISEDEPIKDTTIENEGDEFASEDEFSSEIEKPTSKKPFILLDDVGAVVYNEFGKLFQGGRLLAGAFCTFELPAGFYFLPEVLFQTADSNKAIIYMLNLYNDIEWENQQRTTISAFYYGKQSLQDNSIPTISFSNIFAGEVLRLDALNMPFYQIDLKHSFMKYRLRFKLQYTKQIFDEKMEEIDLSISKKIAHNFDFIFINSAFKANSLEKTNYMTKLEVRISF